jgi:hypothetical protein
LLPGIVRITTVDRVEAKIVDEAKHCCPRSGGSPATGRAILPLVPFGTPFPRRLLARTLLNA